MSKLRIFTLRKRIYQLKRWILKFYYHKFYFLLTSSAKNISVLSLLPLLLWTVCDTNLSNVTWRVFQPAFALTFSVQRLAAPAVFHCERGRGPALRRQEASRRDADMTLRTFTATLEGRRSAEPNRVLWRKEAGHRKGVRNLQQTFKSVQPAQFESPNQDDDLSIFIESIFILLSVSSTVKPVRDTPV